MSADTVERFLRAIGKHDAVAVYGFTSMLEYTAREMLSRGLHTQGRVRTAWNGGEMLYQSQSDLFKEAFGVPIYNFYGGRELGPTAYQRPTHSGLSVVRPFVMLEVVDEAGRPANPGETGRLILTSTTSKGTPFIRYDVGDLGRYAAEGSNESGIHTLQTLEGRKAGLFTLPNGRTINSLYWNHLFKDFPEVWQFQVALVEDKRLELRLRGDGFDPQRSLQLQETLRRFIGNVPVSVDWRSELPLTQQGKLLQVVKEP